MTDEIVIHARNVSKAYRIWKQPSSRLIGPLQQTVGDLFPPASAWRQRVHAAASRHHRDFFALRDVSFVVRRGESLGIIGRNGSGKSTLLQILAGILQPSKGECTVNGRVAALLELGSGFNPEFTGRENVMLNGAILGFSSAEMAERFSTIADFAEIGDFLDQPVKTYSSGMMVRLAFAVAISVEPDVLIVDEALSVGDVFFQQKCFERIRQVLSAGTTFLLVSHDTAAIRNLCDRAVLLDHGEIVFDGPPEEAVSRYFSVVTGARIAQLPMGAASRGKSSSAFAELKRETSENDILPRARSRHGNGDGRLVAAAFVNDAGLHLPEVQLGGSSRILVLARSIRAIARPNCGIHVYDRMNNLIFATGLLQLGCATDPMLEGEERIFELALQWTLGPGEYTFSVGFGEPDMDSPNTGIVFDRHEGLGPVTVLAPAGALLPFYGIAQMATEITEWR